MRCEALHLLMHCIQLALPNARTRLHMPLAVPVAYDLSLGATSFARL
jgi:hypothetical protein